MAMLILLVSFSSKISILKTATYYLPVPKEEKSSAIEFYANGYTGVEIVNSTKAKQRFEIDFEGDVVNPFRTTHMGSPSIVCVCLAMS